MPGIGESADTRAVSAGNSQVNESAPRTRGDGPESDYYTAVDDDCSPHARGWSLHQANGLDVVHLLPVSAGMAL
ncbi:hypothetical protein GCM10010304_81180 [Streptomyces roseoviolaceus]